jgi:hypothetical protein
MSGARPTSSAQKTLTNKYPDFEERLPVISEVLRTDQLPYTQWEAYLAAYHQKPLFVAVPDPGAPRNKHYQLVPSERHAQQVHLQRLRKLGQYPEISFANVDQLASRTLRSTVLDLLTEAAIRKENSFVKKFTEFIFRPRNIVMGAALVIPSLTSIASFAPSWPSHSTAVTTFVSLLALVLIFLHLKSHPKTIKSIVISGVSLFVVVSCAYFVVISLYTYELPATKTRYAIGFVCTPEALMVYKEKCPHLGDDELRAAEYDSERLWTRYSITIVETCLWLLWVSAFVSIGTLAAAFAATEIDFRKFDTVQQKLAP